MDNDKVERVGEKGVVNGWGNFMARVGMCREMKKGLCETYVTKTLYLYLIETEWL